MGNENKDQRGSLEEFTNGSDNAGIDGSEDMVLNDQSNERENGGDERREDAGTTAGQ